MCNDYSSSAKRGSSGITMTGFCSEALRILTGTYFLSTKAERQQHIIQLHIDKKAEYDTYFHVQHEITAAYLQLRNEYATKKFGKKYKQCSNEQRKECMVYYPQRISERIEDMQGKEVQP